MDNTTLNTIRQHIIDNEEQPTNPYLDFKGNLTIGTGFKIETEEEFLSLALINKNTKFSATNAEKKAEFANMQKLREEQARKPEKFNRTADNYEEKTTLRMPKVEQDKHLDREIATRVEKIKKNVGADTWDKLSDGKKAAVVDVHYTNGSLKKFPALKKAIEDGDAAAMAREGTFYTDKENGKRDMGRLTRNRAAVMDEDTETARSKLNEQFESKKTASQSAPGDDDVKGSSGADTLVADESTKAGRRPEVQSFLEDLKKSDNPLADILLKQTGDWTEDEVGQVHRSDAYADPRQPDVAGKVRQWYEQHYGTDPVQFDETGRTMQPVFTTVPKKEPAPVLGSDGQPVLDGVLGVGAKIADLADKSGLSTAIRGVQSGLNLLDKTGTLKTDGLFGPKTKQALRESVAELGRPKVENALALGSFWNLLEKKRGDLAETVHDSFSGLFQAESQYKPSDKSPTPWGLVVQDTINDVGASALGKDAFKPLNNDGWIGPKTSDAFRRTVKPTGMASFMEKLGNNFGFF
ncbi:MAG: hypothetical protein ISR53_09435 [Rhodospirillales bacterium]|nr:hypothetical protein [Rhodospirillales bacterium]MBL6942366.1 hypothetical protein [Rhodospirillales bacterium]